MSVYLFVDGGYLREKFKKCMLRYHDQDVDLNVPETVTALVRMGSYPGDIQKAFYYDCVDERQGPNESPGDVQGRVKEQELLFNKIREAPGWHVREGRLVGSRKESRSQKRVDVLLAVEMLSHAFNKNMEKAILIAGDDDFTPLVEELLRHGSYVEVWSDFWSGSRHLIHAADSGRRMGYPFYWHLAPFSFQRAHALPDDASAMSLPGGRLLKFGTGSSGQTAKIFDVGGTFHFCVYPAGRPVSRLRASSLKVLEEYLSDHFAEKELVPESWQDPLPATFGG